MSTRVHTCAGVLGLCLQHVQAATGQNLFRTTSRLLAANGGAGNLFAGVIAPCFSVGFWKSMTLGLNHNLMMVIAGE